MIDTISFVPAVWSLVGFVTANASAALADGMPILAIAMGWLLIGCGVAWVIGSASDLGETAAAPDGSIASRQDRFARVPARKRPLHRPAAGNPLRLQRRRHHARYT